MKRVKRADLDGGYNFLTPVLRSSFVIAYNFNLIFSKERIQTNTENHRDVNNH